MLLTMNASVPLADKFHKNTGKAQLLHLLKVVSPCMYNTEVPRKQVLTKDEYRNEVKISAYSTL